MCSGQFWTPMQNPGSAWYEKDERYHGRNLNPLKKPERNHLEFFKDAPARKGKLLDVGMGTGNFLAAAVARGYDGYGIDFDRDAIAAAERVFGLKNIAVKSLEDVAREHATSFDVVTAFEVVEHLENPVYFSKQVRELLRDDGYLAISVPYRGLPEFLKLHDKPPRHLTRWNKHAMEYFLTQHGFEVVRMRIIPITIPFLVTKFHFWFGKWFSTNLVSRIALKSTEGANPVSQSSKIIWAQRLARGKDYILFSIPAILLWLALTVSGKNGLGLYALARKAQ